MRFENIDLYEKVDISNGANENAGTHFGARKVRDRITKIFFFRWKADESGSNQGKGKLTILRAFNPTDTTTSIMGMGWEVNTQSTTAKGTFNLPGKHEDHESRHDGKVWWWNTNYGLSIESDKIQSIMKEVLEMKCENFRRSNKKCLSEGRNLGGIKGHGPNKLYCKYCVCKICK